MVWFELERYGWEGHGKVAAPTRSALPRAAPRGPHEAGVGRGQDRSGKARSGMDWFGKVRIGLAG
jgi:hypothetical protein